MKKIFTTLSFLLFLVLGQKVEAQKCQVKLDYWVHDTTNEYYFIGTTNNWPKFSYKWDLGDGNTSTAQSNLHHTYKTNGTYKVCLYTDSAGCKDTSCATVVATKKNPCNADFTAAPDNSNPLKWHFSAIDTLEDYYSWGWATTKKTSYTFSSVGTSNIFLWVHNYKDHCRDTVFKKIEVKKCYAGFTSSINHGTKTASFTNSSSTNITHYLWKFGDGTTLGWGRSSANQNPTHQYSKTGNYWVTFKVKDSTTNCIDSLVSQITISGCDGNFSITEDSKINFKYFFKSPYTPTGNYIKNEWYINWSKQSANLDSFSHTFSAKGNYNVCHAYRDTIQKCGDTICKTIYIGGCDSSFTYRVSNDSLYFSYSGGGTKPRWDFGDGTIDTVSTQGIHVYSKASGYYQVCLSTYCVTTKLTSKSCLTILAKNKNCKANFSFKADSTNPYKINFTNLSPTSSSAKYIWFGDAGTHTSKDLSFTFSKSGNVNVCLMLLDSATSCSDTVCKTLYVGKPRCDSSFSHFVRNDSLFYAYTGSGAKSLKWDFGDGYSYKGGVTQGKYQYAKPGTYTVCLTAYCSSTDSSQKCTTIIIGCVSDFNVSTKDTAITFYTSVLKPQQKCKWTFSDGQQLRDTANGIHHFKRSSYYQICLTVYCSSKDSDVFCLTLGTPCISKFTYTKDINASKVTFTNQSSVNFTNYLWRFGDGNTSTAKNPTHTYSNSGGYTVSLECFDSIKKCKDTMTEFIALYECKSLYTLALDTTQKFKLYLINKSSSYKSNKYYWDFGDGNFSNQKNPTHKYSKFGKFRICLTVKDSSKTQNCSTTYCDTMGLDSNGRLLKAGGWELVVIDETVFGVKKIVTSDFKIYPNPANSKVTIDMSNTSHQYDKLEVINANGQVCIVQTLDAGIETMEVDLDYIKPGLYLIKLSSDQGYSYLKMIKN